METVAGGTEEGEGEGERALQDRREREEEAELVELKEMKTVCSSYC